MSVCAARQVFRVIALISLLVAVALFGAMAAPVCVVCGVGACAEAASGPSHSTPLFTLARQAPAVLPLLWGLPDALAVRLEEEVPGGWPGRLQLAAHVPLAQGAGSG